MKTKSKRVAVITGASRGVGAGLAKHFQSQGFSLGLCSRSPAVLPDGDQVKTAALDVSDGEAVDAFCESVAQRFGPIDLWVNNAGVLGPIDPLRDVTSASFRRHLEINVLGVFHGSRAYIRHCRSAQHAGVLINISSGAGRSPYEGWAAYCAGKAAVDRLTQVIALEEADTGLRAYAVAPGVIDTGMQAQIRDMTPDRFPLVERFIEMKEQDSFSTAEQVAEGILELAFGDHHQTEVLVDLRG